MNVPAQQHSATSPGRPGFLSRQRGWLIGPAFFGLVLSVVVAYLWPDTFQSTTVVRYQSATSDNLAFEKSLNDRMQAALGRSELKTIIERYELYPNDLKRLPSEDIIENMRRKVHFGRISRRDTPLSKSATFPVAFDYPDRFKAQKVARDLAALIVADSQRATTAPPTPGLSTHDLEGARKDLEDSEAKITEFREKNTANLPEQSASDQDKMSALRSGLTKLQSQIAEATREQAALQASLAAALEKRRNLKLTVDAPEPDKTENPKLAPLNVQIAALEDQIKTLKVQYTENFPDVKQARQKLDKLKADRDAILKEDAAKVNAAKQRVDAEATRAAAALDADVKRIQAQMEAKVADTEKLSKDSIEMDRSVRAMQEKLEGSSELEKQYAELLKDRDLRKSRFDEEQIRFQASVQGATDIAPTTPSLADVVDAANLPSSPIEPNRAFLIGAGTLIGVLVGLAAAGAREMNDRSLRNLYGIPEAAAHEIDNRSGWMKWLVTATLGLGAMAASILHYYATRN